MNGKFENKHRKSAIFDFFVVKGTRTHPHSSGRGAGSLRRSSNLRAYLSFHMSLTKHWVLRSTGVTRKSRCALTAGSDDLRRGGGGPVMLTFTGPVIDSNEPNYRVGPRWKWSSPSLFLSRGSEAFGSGFAFRDIVVPGVLSFLPNAPGIPDGSPENTILFHLWEIFLGIINKYFGAPEVRPLRSYLKNVLR